MRILPLMLLLLTGCQGLENRLVFLPMPAEPEQPLPPGIQDITLAIPDASAVHARWTERPAAARVILYCHGNGGNLEHWGGLVHRLGHRLDASVLIFDYPGYGRSEGKPTESGCYAAAQAAYNWLTRTRRIPPENIILMGESLGGGVAVELASRNEHAALVLMRTFTSLPGAAQAIYPWLPCAALMVNRFESEERLRRCSRPLFLAQADKDRIIPFEHAKLLRAAHGSVLQTIAVNELHVLEGLGHNDPSPESFFSALRRFLDDIGA